MRHPVASRESQLVVAAIFMLCTVLPLGATEFEKWLIMPGEVTSGHAEFEADCALCHSPLADVPQVELCLDCHKDISNEIALRWGLHARLAEQNQTECSTCHTDHEGRDQDITALDEDTFDHSMTEFGLHGLHLGVTCTACHAAGESFRSAPSNCVDCHVDDDVHGTELNMECDACHIAGGWQFQTFDHTVTAFALSGAHRSSTCDACHATNDFSGASGLCIDCHQSDDVHAGRNGPQCGECHTDTTWTAVDFDHFAVTGFGLVDGHGGLACADCHQQPDHSGLGGATCNSCHASDDIHEGQFGVQCDGCHNVTRWQAAKFDHVRQAGFALPAGHNSLLCESCHTGKLTDPLPVDCAGCHRDDDPHRGQLGDDCASCHVASSWVAQLWFDHDITAFPLLGSHAELECASCHESAAFH
ncbi:MAG: cytochrome c3 family protein, partial [Woeseiaceae bacterium]